MIHKFVIIHYHLRDGGVTKVIESQIKALKEADNSLEITLITSSPRPSFIDSSIKYIQIKELDYITISTLGNAQDFGDVTQSRYQLDSTSNRTDERGVSGGGSGFNIIDYITISTPGNAQDFGDLTVGRFGVGASSNS